MDGIFSSLMREKEQQAQDDKEAKEVHETRALQRVEFGSALPFAEPPSLQGFNSPYYAAAHLAWRKRCRAFVEEHLEPHAAEWDEAGALPPGLRRRMYKAGMLAVIWPAQYGGTPPPGSEHGSEHGSAWHGAWQGTRVDPFFDLIHMDELARCASGGALANLFSFGIGLPPILLFGGAAMAERVARPVITGEATMCLCVTEPAGGSDVARIATTARRSADGSHFVVNGQKKWITGGTHADFFTVLCRTDGAQQGAAGLSMLLLEKGMPGITCRRMRTQGWWASSTAFVEFDNVRVPAANLIGAEGQGFAYTMLNFNHERFMLSVQMNRFSRVCLEEAVGFARRRRTFGKRLADHQVIRHKVAEMARRVEGSHALLESYCYQVRTGLPDAKLYGFMAWLKVQCSRTMEFCAREASQILGGASFTRDGVGQKVERIYREVRVMAIGGGSEEVMLNLAMSHAKL
jgi:alkylation response protein AidB-like acyl-CoA dehydrogenase